jgi:hypothetical protein
MFVPALTRTSQRSSVLDIFWKYCPGHNLQVFHQLDHPRRLLRMLRGEGVQKLLDRAPPSFCPIEYDFSRHAYMLTCMLTGVKRQSNILFRKRTPR